MLRPPIRFSVHRSVSMTWSSAHLPCRIVLTCALLAACAVLGGVARAAAPPYLAEMPTPEQVEATVRGSDAVDTAVRQAEALGQLCWVVRSLSQGGEFGNRMMREETAQCALYQQASSAIAKRVTGLPPFGPQSWAMRSWHYHNDDFRGEVLSDFPKVKAIYVARKGADAAALGPRGGGPFVKLGMMAIAFGCGVAGLVLLLLGTRRLRPRQAQAGADRGRDPRIVRSIDGTATNLVPHDAAMVVEHLCLGEKTEYYSYTASVSTDASGNVSGGGTQTGSYVVFEFGLAVHNTGAVSNRFQVSIAVIDNDQYVVGNRNIRCDVAPGEKRRIWTNVSARKNSDFSQYILKEIGFGPTPTEPKAVAQHTAKTAPNLSIYDAFGLAQAPLEMGSPRRGSGSGGCLLIVAGLFMLFVALATGMAAANM